MRLLLDTQVALWWLTASRRLSQDARTVMSASPCAISVASIWEVDLKHRLGKLPVSPARFRDEMRSAGVTVLPVTDEHVLTAVDLPRPHSDPFDRLLLSIASAEHLILLTADEALLALAADEPRLPVRGV